ncbi:arginine/serine-rich splicing factor, putative [Cordyceps militaris CM01]|uniref:Arginine/serine-rich splicing factor, putative n=1 Tax=Cordyceps militaris (strain CM01) TaxID=983644 RepID=G3J4E0_CORMM|nr:arginine/serine-rich splicing factor, putative [Cordyceps militaris CM01]EGX96657.1 arginine/serine-rich splicing factor, putative [Cordyceps militaris CM01]
MTSQQEPEFHATAASLSPVSPYPVHTIAPVVVPALQDTVDTIEAMVAAVADAPNAAVEANPTIEAAKDGFVDDDDSFDAAYAEDSKLQLLSSTDAGDQDPNDDYARMFDSPVGSDQEEEEEDASVDVSAALDSTLCQAQPIQARNNAASSSVSASNSNSSPSTPDAPASQPAAQPHAGHDAPVPPPLEAAKTTDAPPADAHPDQQLFSQYEPISNLNPHADDSHGFANPATTQTDNLQATASSDANPTTLASTSSLPPRPPLPQPAAHSYSQTSVTGSVQASQIAAGPTREAGSTVPLPPQPVHGTSAPSVARATTAPADQAPDEYQRLWDQFMVDERLYMSEAKWDRFPEGSRLFIGNLSSDKVSKKDVFEIFHKYGRLAQISLKSAYGFVQYHTVEEGSRAVQSLEGIEIKGRRIHLEVSKLQDKSKKERNKSPERGSRGRDGARKGDKYYDRDERRGGRHHSPRRQGHHGRDSSYSGRDKFHDSGRGRDRSRSPGYGRSDKSRYRKRSNSPYGGRSRYQDKQIDLPRRYGAEVPDVQIITPQEVNREFTKWVEHIFNTKGLRTEVMILHSQFPKDQVIQRQAAEGVHAVVELDMRAQDSGMIPVQVFDRSGGSNNVRFDQYVDLLPSMAGDIVIRAKNAAAATAAAAAAYTQQSYAGYQYQPPAQQHPQRGGYGGAAPPPVAYVSAAPAAPAAPAITNIGDIARLVGHVDNGTLQRVLTAMAGPVPNAMPAAATPPVGNPSVDINALLSALSGPVAHTPPAAPAAAHFGGAYGGGGQVPPHHGPSRPSGTANGDSAAVQNIMANLSRYRQ